MKLNKLCRKIICSIYLVLLKYFVYKGGEVPSEVATKAYMDILIPKAMKKELDKDLIIARAGLQLCSIETFFNLSI